MSSARTGESRSRLAKAEEIDKDGSTYYEVEVPDGEQSTFRLSNQGQVLHRRQGSWAEF